MPSYDPDSHAALRLAILATMYLPCPSLAPSLTLVRSGNNNASTGQQSAGLFGTSTASSQPPSQTGGLFGGASTAASQPPQSSGLFGGQQQQQQQLQQQQQEQQQQQQQHQQASQPQSGGLFSNLNNKPAGSTNLFGGSTAQPQPQPQ